MLFWIIAALIALAVAAILCVPLLRSADTRRGAEDVAIYRDQLAEVDRDLARGVLDPAEAERARTEIARRLLAADRTGPQTTAEAPRGASRIVAGITALVLAGGGLVAYAELGQPGYPDIPLAGRLASSEERLANLPAQAVAEAAVADRIAANRLTPPDDIAATVAELREAIVEMPDALGELSLLRDFEAGTRNFPEAAVLTAQINDVLGAEVTLRDLLIQIELMVLATNGVMTADSADVLDRAIAMAPEDPGVLLYRGLLMENIGRPDLAFALWRPLAETIDSPYRDRVRQMLPQVAAAAGITYSLPPEAPAAAGPSAEQMAAAAEMEPEARAAMIEGMVSQLSERLATQGGTAEEWAQLIRALGVLGETDRARAIWTEAQEVFAGQEGLDLIAAAAADAGVAG